MKRSPERRIGFGRWLIGALIIVALLFAGFSLMPAALLEGEWPMRISAREVSVYAGLFDRRPQEESVPHVESYRFGASEHDGLCLIDHNKPGWHRRWFEAEGYGDSVDVRRSREFEGAWDLRFDRAEPFDRQMRIMLIPADVESIRAKYLEIVAKELGLLTPEISFVRIIACGKDLGIFLEQEHIGPEFMEKNRMPDAEVFEQGFDPERPDQLFPDMDGDTLASRAVRSLLQQLSLEVGKQRPADFPFGVAEQAAIAWSLLRSMENDDPFQDEGVFAYRWSTGMILPLYRYSCARTQADTSATIAFNPISALWWRASFRAGGNARRDQLLKDFDGLKERFAEADSAWLPILAGNTSLRAAQARAGVVVVEMHERLKKVRFDTTQRIMVPRVGYALAPRAAPGRDWPGDNDREVLDRIGKLKAEVRGDTIVFPRRKYVIDADLIFPYGYTIVMEQGARLSMAPGVSVLCLGPLLVRGTMRNPVFVRPAMDDQPFGSLAVSCSAQEQCKISGLKMSGGSGAIINGIRHDAMLSIIGASNTELGSCVFGGSSGDGVNITGGRVELVGSLFEGSGEDLVDLDFVTGSVLDCVFKGGAEGASGDALSLSGSNVSVERCRISDMMGAGVNAGEASEVSFRSNTMNSNRIAIASNDGATVNAGGNVFTTNGTVFSAQCRKPIHGGGRLLLGPNTLENNGREREVDALSKVVVQDSLSTDVVKRSDVE